MATDDSTTYDVTQSEYDDSHEWGFRADIRVRITNPDGDDVIAVRTYKARPKFDDLVADEDHVFEHTDYWETNAYPANGDRPFSDSTHDWEPVADIIDDEALFEECLEAATLDAQAELESLSQ
jgi:uncharacterized protein YcgI (DUF1989 family)